MSAVELWKAPQPLLFQGCSADSSKWRAVGIGENTLPHCHASLCIKISSITLNRISASSPMAIHRDFAARLNLKNQHTRALQTIMQRMPSIDSHFTPLEKAVLRAICESHVDDRSALESQLSTAAVLRRENTGAGFYTEFAVERVSQATLGGERLRTGPAARVDGLKQGMGFILWLKEGYAHNLEGYSYGESTTGIEFEQTGFEILHD